MEDNTHGPNGPTTQSPSSETTNNNKKNIKAITKTNNKEQDRFLPIANVGRIMKKVIPANGKISKDAKETIQECVSEFISFITGEASDKCQREKRKTINGDDIIWAITTLGFEEYVGPLKLYLNKYRDIEGEKINAPKQQRTQQEQEQEQNTNTTTTTTTTVPYNSSLYSSTTSNIPFMSQPSFMYSDHQAFSLNFSPKPLQQDHQIDSIGHW